MNDSRDVPAGEFRRHMAEHLDRVRAGETFVITRNGRVTALVAPAVEDRSVRTEVEER